MIDMGFKPNLVAHNSKLEGLLRSEKWYIAINLLKVMKAKLPRPNIRSYKILIQRGFIGKKR